MLDILDRAAALAGRLGQRLGEARRQGGKPGSAGGELEEVAAVAGHVVGSFGRLANLGKICDRGASSGVSSLARGPEGAGQGREIRNGKLFGPRGGVEPGPQHQRFGSGTSVFRLWRSILRRWPKAAGRHLFQIVQAARPPPVRASGSIRTTAEVTLGGGVKARGRDLEQDFRAARATASAPTAAHRPCFAGAATSRSATSRWNIKRQALPERRPGLGRQPFHQQRAADVVGQVGGDAHRPGRRSVRANSAASSSASASAGTMSRRPGKARGDLFQRGDAAVVALHRDHAAAPSVSSARVKPAGARPHFIERRVFERARRARDAPRQVEVEQEVLAQRFLRRQPMRAR